MKKTFTINISGTVFHIDDDAFEKLNEYLHNINRHFRNDSDAKEILEDIEMRIAELFNERLKKTSEVVTIELVNQIIEIMGSADTFGSTDDVKNDTEPTTKTKSSYSKKLYRDPDDRILGGVCSGIGAYFAIDPIVFRVLFLIFFFLPIGSSLLIYLILWIVVPRASNITQRLEMRGEEVTVSNISKTIKEEFQEVSENYKKFRNNNSNSHINQKIREIGDFLAQIFWACAKFLIIFIGGALILCGVVLLIGLIISFFATGFFFDFLPYNSLNINSLNLFFDSKLVGWFSISVLMVAVIPLIAIVYLGIKLIFRVKLPNRLIGSLLILVWIIGILMLIFTVTIGLKSFRNSSVSQRQELLSTKSDTIFLELGENKYKDLIDNDLQIANFRVASIDGKQTLLGKPYLNIEKTDSKDFSINIVNHSRGESLDNAQKNAREIIYNIEKNDSIVTFQPWFKLPENRSWRNQEVIVTLRVPENKTIFFNENMLEIMAGVSNTSNIWDGDMVRKYWTMKPDGLTLVNRATTNSETNKKQ